jgi:hypothetical protein
MLNEPQTQIQMDIENATTEQLLDWKQRIANELTRRFRFGVPRALPLDRDVALKFARAIHHELHGGEFGTCAMPLCQSTRTA